MLDQYEKNEARRRGETDAEWEAGKNLLARLEAEQSSGVALWTAGGMLSADEALVANRFGLTSEQWLKGKQDVAEHDARCVAEGSL